MAVTLLVLSGAFYVGTSGQLAWIAVLSVAAYVGFFAIGLGPVFWLLIAEIFPLALRGRAMSLATVANWSFNLIVSATFLNLVGAVGSAGAFLVYALLSMAALAFVAQMVPETKGRSLEQIEASLDAGNAPRRLAKRARHETRDRAGDLSRRGAPSRGADPLQQRHRLAAHYVRRKHSGLCRATGRAPAGRFRRRSHRSDEPRHLIAVQRDRRIRQQHLRLVTGATAAWISGQSSNTSFDRTRNQPSATRPPSASRPVWNFEM